MLPKIYDTILPSYLYQIKQADTDLITPGCVHDVHCMESTLTSLHIIVCFDHFVVAGLAHPCIGSGAKYGNTHYMYYLYIHCRVYQYIPVNGEPVNGDVNSVHQVASTWNSIHSVCALLPHYIIPNTCIPRWPIDKELSTVGLHSQFLAKDFILKLLISYWSFWFHFICFGHLWVQMCNVSHDCPNDLNCSTDSDLHVHCMYKVHILAVYNWQWL